MSRWFVEGPPAVRIAGRAAVGLAGRTVAADTGLGQGVESTANRVAAGTAGRAAADTGLGQAAPGTASRAAAGIAGWAATGTAGWDVAGIGGRHVAGIAGRAAGTADRAAAGTGAGRRRYCRLDAGRIGGRHVAGIAGGRLVLPTGRRLVLRAGMWGALLGGLRLGGPRRPLICHTAQGMTPRCRSPGSCWNDRAGLKGPPGGVWPHAPPPTPEVAPRCALPGPRLACRPLTQPAASVPVGYHTG